MTGSDSSLAADPSVAPSLAPALAADVAVVQGIPAVPTLLDVVCRTTGMGFAAIARVTEGHWVACGVLDKIAFGLRPGGELQVETTLCHEIRQSREPVVIDEVAEDLVYCNHHTPRQYGFQSYISVPIVLPGDRFFGTLCAIDPRPARLKTPEVIGMFQLFAELIAFHIDVAQRLSETEARLLAEREASVLREQFIGVLGHDLRTPLGALSIGVSGLREGPLTEDQRGAAEMMERSVNRMSDLIVDALDFTRGRLGGGITLESRTDGSVEEVLMPVIEETRRLSPGRQVLVELDLREPVRFDRKRLAQLFCNLLVNAVTHGKPGTPVKVSAQGADGRFELSVANAADQIPEAILERLFEPFSRGGASDYREGLGLGLYIASEIAKSHGGKLSVVSTPNEVSFTFAMPTAV